MAAQTQEANAVVGGKGKDEFIFSISYDAKDNSLAEHEINAKELGEAILGMHNLIDETAKVISSDSAGVELNVTTPAKEGSVEVVFSLLADPGVALKILGTLGFAAQGAAIAKAALVEFIKKLATRKSLQLQLKATALMQQL